MGNMEVPTTNQQVVKMPLGTYEFGANLVSNQVGQPEESRSMLNPYCEVTYSRHVYRQVLTASPCCAGQHDDWARADRWSDDWSNQVRLPPAPVITYRRSADMLYRLRCVRSCVSTHVMVLLQVRLCQLVRHEAAAADGTRERHVPGYGRC